MATIHKTTADPAVPPQEIHAQTPPRACLVKKVALASLGLPRTPVLNWGIARVFSPGKAFGYKTTSGIEYAGGVVQLFCSGPNSQGLIVEGDHVAGASVTTAVHTSTARKDEKKRTFIQYDKTRVLQEGADFEVVATNRKGYVNYQGGHLIDHKYSAEGSHTAKMNYFPQHFMINSPFKESLVEQSQAFIEIPLYTPRPPTIGVRSSKSNDPVPVGEIFIQIKQDKMDAIYYFPNNNFDYEGLKERLGISEAIAATMIPYFKLKACFYPLFQSAIVTQCGSKEEKAEQSEREALFIKLMGKVTRGIELAECGDEEDAIVQLAYSVVHKKGEVDPSLFLDCSGSQWDQIKDEPLQAPFNALGRFLVTYVIRNALKSEVLSTHSRLVFLSGWIDFIEADSQVNDEALEFIDSLAEEFKNTFEELQKTKEAMNLEDLFFFADDYRRISDCANLSLFFSEYKIYFREPHEFLVDYIEILKCITLRYEIKELEESHAAHFLTCIQSAQASLEYWVEAGFPEEMFASENRFLKSMVDPCLTLFDGLYAGDQTVSATFSSNIHRETSIRAIPDNVREGLENLGLFDEVEEFLESQALSASDSEGD